MGDDQLGGVDPAQHLGQLSSASRVQIRGGLVQRQEPGPHGQHRGERHSTSLSCAEVVRGPVAQHLGPHRHERFLDGATQLVSSDAEVRRAEGDVVADGGGEKLVVGVLEDQTHLPSDLAKVVRLHPQPSHHDLPGLRLQKTVQVQDQRGLTGTVGSQHRHSLAGCDRERQLVERRGIPARIGVAQGPDLEVDRAHWARRLAASSPAARTPGTRAASVDPSGADGSPTGGGMTPVNPRATIAWWTRSPRS